MSADPSAFWRLDLALLHLNHGSYGACPGPVLVEQSRWRDRLEADPTGFFTDAYWPALDTARAALAAFVGAAPEGLAFVTNATTGVNAVVRSLEPTLGPGDEVLVTDHAYNACRNVLDAMAARRGVRIVLAPVPFPIQSPDVADEAVVSRASGRTRLALIDHITSPTALVLPIESIVRTLEPSVPVLVDGAHAPGMVRLALDAIGASYAVGNCHKWICAPKGAGYLHVRADHRDAIEPTVISHGWNGRSRVSGNRFHDLFDWPGTFDPTAWLSVPAALEVMGGLLPGGWPALMEANRALALAGRSVVGDAFGVTPPCPDAMIGSMASLVLPPGRSSADELRRRLRHEHGIVGVVSAWPGPDDCLVRISAQQYNRPADYERLATALASLG